MRLSAIVVGVAAGWCLACSGLIDKMSEEASEKSIEAASGGKVDVEMTDGNATVTSADGTASIGAQAKLPDDMPMALPGGAWETQMVISTPEGTMITAKPPAGSTGLDTYFKGELVRLGCPTPNFAQMAGMTTFQCADVGNYETLAVNFLGDGAEQVVQIVYKKKAAAAPADGAAPAEGAPSNP